MTHSPAESGRPLPAPYQCAVCGKVYVHLFDHHCVVADACCHFGEMLITDEVGPHHAHAPVSTPLSLPTSG